MMDMVSRCSETSHGEKQNPVVFVRRRLELQPLAIKRTEAPLEERVRALILAQLEIKPEVEKWIIARKVKYG